MGCLKRSLKRSSWLREFCLIISAFRKTVYFFGRIARVYTWARSTRRGYWSFPGSIVQRRSISPSCLLSHVVRVRAQSHAFRLPSVRARLDADRRPWRGGLQTKNGSGDRRTCRTACYAYGSTSWPSECRRFVFSANGLKTTQVLTTKPHSKLPNWEQLDHSRSPKMLYLVIYVGASLFWDDYCTLFSDIDECATGDHTCHVNAACSNTEGSFTCSCVSGYSGDGMTCIGLFNSFL